MIADITVEQRLARLESQVAELRRTPKGPAENWLEQFTGAFRKYPNFGEVVRHGREFRESQPYADEEDCE